MPYYRYERDDPFRDHANDRIIEAGEVVQLSKAIAEPTYGFVEVDEPDETESNSESTDDAEDPAYSEMDYAELRQLAVEEDTDEINGRSKKSEIVAYFTE